MSEIIYGIDAGPTETALVKLRDGKPVVHILSENRVILERLETARRVDDGRIAFEMVQHYGSGMPAGKEVFDTVLWIGRYVQAWGGPFELLARPKIKSVICGSAKAKDPNVRQALIDRYGGKERAIGNKAAPGPLHGIHSHQWAALAVAVAYRELFPVPAGVEGAT